MTQDLSMKKHNAIFLYYGLFKTNWYISKIWKYVYTHPHICFFSIIHSIKFQIWYFVRLWDIYHSQNTSYFVSFRFLITCKNIFSIFTTKGFGVLCSNVLHYSALLSTPCALLIRATPAVPQDAPPGPFFDLFNAGCKKCSQSCPPGPCFSLD